VGTWKIRGYMDKAVDPVFRRVPAKDESQPITKSFLSDGQSGA
jgi:hypothetical protein